MSESHFKKLFLLSAFSLLLTVASLALAEADGPDYYRVHGVTINSVLNIRSEANIHSKITGAIPSGEDCIKNMGCKGGLTLNEYSTLSKQQQEIIKKQRPIWCHIEYQGINGWASGRYLAEGGCDNEQHTELADRIKDLLVNSYLKNDLPIMKPSDRQFQFHQYDLNGDGEKEIFVRFFTPYFCGTGGCSYLLLHNNGELITHFTVMRAPVFIEKSKINGWSVLLVRDGGVLKELKYENGTYPSNPSMLLKAPYDVPGEHTVILFDKYTHKGKNYSF